MIQLAEVFPDQEIVVTLSRQLGWSHFLAILPLRDPLQRDFYARDVPNGALERTNAARRSAACSSSGPHCRRSRRLLVEQELAKLRKEHTLCSPDLVFRDHTFSSSWD